MNFRGALVAAAAASLLFVLNGRALAIQGFTVPLPLEAGAAVGLGAVAGPDYEGSDDYRLVVLPALNYRFKNRYIRLTGQSLKLNILNHSSFELGPSAFYRFGRTDDIDDDVIQKLRRIDDTFEAGAFLGWRHSDRGDPRYRGEIALEFLQDVGDEHEGSILQLSVQGWGPISKRVDLGILGGITYADEDYMSAFFGVTPADSERSGLPVYHPEGGIKDLYIQPMVMWRLGTSWHIGAGVMIRVLLSDAHQSPVIECCGSDAQVIGGVSMGYSW